MKLNKKILSIIFLTFACFLGINGVKAAQIDECGEGNLAKCDGFYQFYVDNTKYAEGGSYELFKNNKQGSIKQGFCDYESGEKIIKLNLNPIYFVFHNGKYDTKVSITQDPATVGELKGAYKDEKGFVWGITGKITGDGESCSDYLVYSQTIYNDNFKQFGGTDGKNEDEEDFSDIPVTESKLKTSTTNGKTIEFVKKIYNTLKILIPLLVIILSIIDFVKVLASGEDKTYKEAWSNFVKRAIIGILIFLVPTIVSLLLNLSGILGIYEIDKNNIFYIFK